MLYEGASLPHATQVPATLITAQNFSAQPHGRESSFSGWSRCPPLGYVFVFLAASLAAERCCVQTAVKLLQVSSRDGHGEVARALHVLCVEVLHTVRDEVNAYIGDW